MVISLFGAKENAEVLCPNCHRQKHFGE
ncbi:MAG: HNH endonuclease [Candidatus Brocadiales bacterium]|nr:HNH endonuclease [Candidatus Brocadiales bacterium]